MYNRSSLAKWACNLPKTELHLHIEGSLEPEMVFNFAQRNNISIPYENVERLRKAYQFNNLQEFLDVYYAGMSVLITEQDFYDLTMAYLQRIKKDNVVHTEIFFDPQGHLCRGVDFSTQINGIYRALRDGENQLGITSRLIMSFLRHLSEDDGIKTLELAMPHLDKIDGFGLDSAEQGNPPEKFVNLYQRCKQLGKKLTAHAGEEGPAQYVINALDILKVDRIDHGNRSLDNPDLVQRLAKAEIALTVCPLSNLKLCVVKELHQHPIKKMLELNLKATINSDDPAYFGGYINDNYNAIIEHLDLNADDIYQLVLNSFEKSWLSEVQKQAHIDTLKLEYDTFMGRV